MSKGWRTGLTTAAILFSFAPVGRVPLAEVALLLLAVGVSADVRSGVTRWRGSGGWCFWAAAGIVLAGGRTLGGWPVWAEVLQAVLLLWFGVAVFRRACPVEVALGWALGCGAGVSLLVALGQALAGTDATGVAALFSGRAPLGVVLAVTAPWLLSAGRRWRAPRPGAGLPLVLLPVALVLSTWYLPALVLVLAVAVAWAWRVAAPPERRLVLIGLTLGLLFLAAPGVPILTRQREALAASVATVDAAGYARRWVLELRAGRAAVAAAPWLGHGPGAYQGVVSSARFRGDLPPALENRVEQGTQCGYLVLAVECGLPVALLVAAALLHASWLAWRPSPRGGNGDAAGPAPELALSLLALAAGMALTPLLVRGTGVLLAAGLGAALGRRDPCPATSLGKALSRAWALPDTLCAQGMLLLLVLAVSVGLSWVCGQRATVATGLDVPPAPEEPTAVGPRTILHVQAEAATGSSLMAVAGDPDASGGQCLEVAEAAKPELLQDPGREVRFRLEQASAGRLWLRCWWPDGCANSIAVGVDGRTPTLIGNDGTYRVWHWVPGPELDLAPGEHTLSLQPREPLARVDVIAIAVGPGEPTGAAAAPAARLGTGAVPRWESTGRPERARFLAGVGGTYAPGPEAILLQLGVPFERLRDEDLADAAALAAYDLVWIAKPDCPLADAWRALHAYVCDGGTALIEEMVDARGGRSGSGGPDERALLPAGSLSGGAMSHRQRPVQVRAHDSPLFQGLPPEMDLYADIGASILPPLPAGEGESHGQLWQNGGCFGVAFTKRRVGNGSVYALALPLGFVSMWRGPQFDPLAYRILRDAIGERYQPLFGELTQKPVLEGTVHFADDFMRAPGETGPWEVVAGTFEQQDGPPPAPPQFSRQRLQPGPPNALSVRLTAPAEAAAGDPLWHDYRVRASVQADAGEGGVWVTSSTGRQLQARISGTDAMVRLESRTPSRSALLAEAPLKEPVSGWRRISLWHDAEAWQVWVDGLPALRVPAPGETARGRFGLVATGGLVYLDDVFVRAVAAMVPGTDTCAGEEGSCRADYPGRDGVERRSVCSPLWLLRPDPLGRHAVEPVLPLFGTASFAVDGDVLGLVEGHAEPGPVYLPDGRVPGRDLVLGAPAWRDYLFAGQTVDWYGTGGAWEREPRWSCDQQWEWLGIRQGDAPAVWWYRLPLTPPYALATEAALAMRNLRGGGDFDETPRDLNLVLAGGNGTDLGGAWVLRTGRAGSEGCTLLRDDQVLARNPALGLPPEGGHALHHRWLGLRATVEPRRIRIWFDGHAAIDYESIEDVPAGQVGIWTRDNAIQVARAAVSAPCLVVAPQAPGGH